MEKHIGTQVLFKQVNEWVGNGLSAGKRGKLLTVSNIFIIIWISSLLKLISRSSDEGLLED